ncbi:hypothetical protein O3P69_008445 [Scylla paramamosain]|uniref:Uncharacterized protein n=1 Tax=Scylla paramamosain TaxID=85552 RepID=A0AAW0SL53_SCYPA
MSRALFLEDDGTEGDCSVMGVVAVMAAGLLASVVTAINAAHGQSLRASHDVCSRIEFVTGEDHQVVEKVLKKVLKELCETGQRHVVQEQRLSRGGEQFAVLNLHRDAFRATVYWQGGDAKNVVDDSDWRVDEEVALAPGKEEDDAKAKIFYHCFTHMMASFKEQQRARAPKNSKLSRCPDQLYVFLLHKPCQRDLQLLNKKFDDLLSSESCLNITRLVVGYSAEVPPFVC